MAFKTFAPGVLTSSDVNTFLMRQTIITCTSSTRPASPNEGMTIYETNTDATLQYTGTAWKRVLGLGSWQTYTPTVASKSGSAWQIGNGVAQGRYYQIGSAYLFEIFIEIGSTTVKGSAVDGNQLVLGAPPPVRIARNVIGWGYAADVSTSTAHHIEWASDTLGTFVVLTPSGTTSLTGVFASTPFTWATGDSIILMGVIEVAA